MARVLALSIVAWLGACAGAQSTRAPDPCAKQICHGDDGGCDAVVIDDVWIWDGAACVEAYDSGCAAVGPDCGSLYETQAACEAAWARCLDPDSSQT